MCHIVWKKLNGLFGQPNRNYSQAMLFLRLLGVDAVFAFDASRLPPSVLRIFLWVKEEENRSECKSHSSQAPRSFIISPLLSVVPLTGPMAMS